MGGEGRDGGGTDRATEGEGEGEGRMTRKDVRGAVGGAPEVPTGLREPRRGPKTSQFFARLPSSSQP
eukprot:897631-Pyramimonas_sp.AAC.1